MGALVFEGVSPVDLRGLGEALSQGRNASSCFWSESVMGRTYDLTATVLRPKKINNTSLATSMVKAVVGDINLKQSLVS